MPRLPFRILVLAAFGLAGLCLTPAARAEPDLAKAKWVKSTAYVVPKETATEGEGYFSIIEGLNGRLYIGTHANARQLLAGRVRPDGGEDEGRRRCPQGDRQGPQGLRQPGQDPHAQQRRRQRQDLLRHQAGLPRRQGREARGLPRRLPDGLRPEDRQDEGLPHPRAAPGHQQHHARRVARRRLHLDLLRRPARARRELALPDPRPEDRQVPRPDRHASTSTASSSSITWAAPTTRCSAATSSATTRRRTSWSGSSRPSTASRRRRSRTWPTRSGHPINWDISPDGKTLYCAADEHEQRSTPTT